MIHQARKRGPGFTLIELMIVVAILAILASIAIPKFADLKIKADQAATRGNLGALRSALTIYYGDNEGTYPDALDALFVDSKYMSSIPKSFISPYHSPSSDFTSGNVFLGESYFLTHFYAWFYFRAPNLDAGKVMVGCLHPDTKGEIWTQF